jgi:endonuclease/exonuclease/phosphatase family metal-dependent hydrolase
LAVLGAETPPAGELRVMTFNLRYASPRPPNDWPTRRPVMKACLEATKPDLIGTQEGLAGQLADLRSDLPDYAMLGQGREGGDKGEFMAIFYRRDRFELLETKDYWLSATPEVVGSKSWNSSLPRMVTWARFRDKSTGRTFLFVNTHFDHQSEEARGESAKLVRRRLESTPTDQPVLLVGDFNAVAKASAAYATFTGDGYLTDLFRSAPVRKGEHLGTFHGYRQANPTGLHIDWLLGRGGWGVRSAEVIAFEAKGQHPSDHYPVMVTLE